MSAAQLRREDEQARKLARTDFKRPLVLEAGAGTGKTASLVARVAVWCLTGGWAKARSALGADPADARVAERVLERVAMITFTEKAAVEMEQRIGAAFREVLAGKQVPGLPIAELELERETLVGRTTELVAALDRLQVRTIHGFCSTLLSRHALAAGLHPAFDVDADGSVVRRICAEVVSEALPVALGPTPDPHWLVLLRSERGPNDVLEALQTLVVQGVSPAGLRCDPYPAEEVEAFVALLATPVGELVETLRAVLPERPAGHLIPIGNVRDALVELLEVLSGDPSPEDLCCAAQRTQGVWARIDDLARKGPNKTEQGVLGAHGESVSELCGRLKPLLRAAAELDVELARSAHRVLAGLLEEVERRRRARGVLTFTDLLEKARALLRDDEAVRRAVRVGLDQLLVDEFQDTDDVQCELVRWIALDGPLEERPGLFLVGDPKQSIYGWRSADLSAYEGMRAEVEQAGGLRARLYVNYRSSQQVLDEVQRLVEPVMQPLPGLQPGFQPLIEGRKPDKQRHAGLLGEERRAIEHWGSRGYAARTTAPPDKEGSKTSAERARELEARQIAHELVLLRQAGVPLGKCALLLRQATQQEVYLAALREQGVPYVVGRDRDFYRTREVVEATALVAAVVDPGDFLALLTLLRSPLGGVPDAALAPLWRAGLPELAARLDGRDDETLARAEAAVERASAQARAALAELSDAGLERVERWPVVARACLRALSRLRRAIVEEPADHAVELLRAWLLPEAVEAARFPGPHRLANLERFLRDLLEALCTVEGGAHGVLRELRAGLAGDVDKESAPPGGEDLSAVRVLTIHAAKGLQFAAVWLADLHHKPVGPQRAAAARVDRLDGRLEVELFGAAGLRRAEIEERREALGRAEQVRLLYVATTRAEDRLVLAGLPGKPDGKPDTLSDLVARREGQSAPWIELEAALADPEATGVVERGGARWRLLGSSAPPAAGADRTTPEVKDGTLDTRAAREIVFAARAAREQACRRAARPLLAAASSSPHLVEIESREQAEGTTCVGREAARAVGVAVHAALERWDVTLPPDQALAGALEGLAPRLAARLAPAEQPAALARARELVEGFARSPLGARLAELAPHLVARELPLVLEARADAGPTGAWVGAADLVYAEEGGLVVADFKTDAAADERELVERYAPQLVRYAEALRLALGAQVRAELWLVATGRIAPVPLI